MGLKQVELEVRWPPVQAERVVVAEPAASGIGRLRLAGPAFWEATVLRSAVWGELLQEGAADWPLLRKRAEERSSCS